MRKERGLLLAVNAIITGLLIFFDQFTKYLALTKLKGEEAIVLIQGVLELDYLENRGSAFGMFQNQKVFLLASGFVFLAFILYFMLKIPIEKKYLLIHYSNLQDLLYIRHGIPVQVLPNLLFSMKRELYFVETD